MPEKIVMDVVGTADDITPVRNRPVGSRAFVREFMEEIDGEPGKSRPVDGYRMEVTPAALRAAGFAPNLPTAMADAVRAAGMDPSRSIAEVIRFSVPPTETLKRAMEARAAGRELSPEDYLSTIDQWWVASLSELEYARAEARGSLDTRLGDIVLTRVL